MALEPQINLTTRGIDRLGSLTVDTIHFLALLFSSTDYQLAATGRSDHTYLVHIRAAQSADLTDVAEVLTDSFHSQQGIFGWAYPLLRLGIYEDLRNRLRSTSPHHTCLVALVGDQLAGTVEMGIRSTDWVSSSHPYISNLAVHPKHRRQGVARQLLLDCERVALSWGFDDLYLHVLENNHQARQLYFQMGYQLHQVDSRLSVWLLRRPRQLLLHKGLGKEITEPR